MLRFNRDLLAIDFFLLHNKEKRLFVKDSRTCLAMGRLRSYAMFFRGLRGYFFRVLKWYREAKGG